MDERFGEMEMYEVCVEECPRVPEEPEQMECGDEDENVEDEMECEESGENEDEVEDNDPEENHERMECDDPEENEDDNNTSSSPHVGYIGGCPDEKDVEEELRNENDDREW